MSKVVKGARFISKITDVTGVEPTIPPNDDHTLGWRDTDIYVGEWFWNVADAKIYFRDNYGISQLVVPDPSTGKIPVSLLPGNYIGAMVFKGLWDASTGFAPGYPTPPESGDYWIVNVAGNTDLDGITDWQIGDYPVYTKNTSYPGAWDKIDNSEPDIYSGNVIYNRTYTKPGGSSTGITNVDNALDYIYDNIFDNPLFNNTVTIDDATLTANKTLLQINGSVTDKWVNWGGSTMKMGSNGSSNSTLSVGPFDTSNSWTSTLNLHRIEAGSQITRWKMYSSNSDGYIMGYNNSGDPGLGNETNTNTKISAMGDSYFLVGNFGIGTTPSGSYKLEVDGDTLSNGNIVAGTTTKTSNTRIIVRSSDSYTAGVEAYGANQGTGYLYAGQASNYGGGIFYNGDGSPPFATGETADHISFYRRSNNENFVVFSCLHNSNTVEFQGGIEVSGIIDVASDVLIGGNLYVTGATSLYSTLDVSGTLDINGSGISTFTGKLQYDNYATVTINNLNDITHKNYVDDEILAHAIGWWRSGTTQTPTIKDVVVWNSTHTYKVGINKLDPTFDLDVIGNASITTTLDVGGNINAGNNVNVDGNIYFLTGGDRTIEFSGTDNSDDLTIKAGDANAGADAGDLTLQGGYSGGHGGEVYVTGGEGDTTGGHAYVTGGENILSGAGGNVYITGGVSSGAVGGEVRLSGGSGTSEGHIKLNSPTDITGNVVLGGDLDLNGDLDVSGTGVIGTFHGTGDITLANESVRITSDGGGSTGMALRFFHASVGHVEFGMEPSNVTHDLTMKGNDVTDTSTGGRVFLRGGNSDNGDGGDIHLEGGEGGSGAGDYGGDTRIYGGDGYGGGDIFIIGGTGNGTDGGDVTIAGGSATGGGSQGDVYIKSTGVSGFKGIITIDHQINETYAQSINNTSDTPVTINQVVPSMYNFINVDLYGNSYSGGNSIILYLGILEIASSEDIMVTISGRFDVNHATLADSILIRKGSSGTTTILSLSGLSTTSNFVATLVWNNVRNQWGIIGLASEGTAPTTPNGVII
jgi:hypothetical protein